MQTSFLAYWKEEMKQYRLRWHLEDRISVYTEAARLITTLSLHDRPT